MSRPHPDGAHRDADLTLGPPLAADAFRADAAALAAITSGYEDARARIISADPPTPAGRHRAEPTEAAPPGWAPTVPVELVHGLARPLQVSRAAADAAPPSSAPPSRWSVRLRGLLAHLGRS